MNASVADWPVARAWKAATAVGSYVPEPSAFTVRSAPLARVIGVPTFAANPLTAITDPRVAGVRIDVVGEHAGGRHGQHRVFVGGDGIIDRCRRVVDAGDVIVKVCGADVSLAVPPLSCSVNVIVAVPTALAAGV